MGARITFPVKDEKAPQSLLEDNLHPYCKGCERRVVMVEIDSHLGMSMCSEQLPGAEATPNSGRLESDQEWVDCDRKVFVEELIEAIPY